MKLIHIIKAIYYRLIIFIHEVYLIPIISIVKKKYNVIFLNKKINFSTGGKVFLTNTKERYIIKGFDIFKLYKNEINILSSLNDIFYPKIIKIEENYFLEEYIEGINFENFIKNNDIKSIENIINQFIECLDDLYLRKIVHRDIRSENIIIYKNDNLIKIKLIDFGCAIKLDKQNFKFPNRVENYLGNYDKKRKLYWDDVEEFLNILKKYNLDKKINAKILKSIEVRVGRIRYEKEN